MDDWDSRTSLDTLYHYFPRPPRHLAYLRSYSVSYLKPPPFNRPWSWTVWDSDDAIHNLRLLDAVSMTRRIGISRGHSTVHDYTVRIA